MNASETHSPSVGAWLAWAWSRLRRPPPIGRGLLQILLLLCIQWLGLAGWCAIANRAAPVVPEVMMPFGVNDSWNSFAGMLVAPALYIAAWQALSFASLRQAMWGGLIGAGLCLAGFVLTGIVTLLAFPAALPVGLACAMVIAKWLAWQDVRDAGEAGSAGQAAHVACLSIALLGLPFAWLGAGGQFLLDGLPRGRNLWDFVAALLPMTLLCLPHAVMTWLLRRPPHPAARLVRAGGFLLPLWALPTWLLGATWPVNLHNDNALQRATHRAELRRFRDSGLFGLGRHTGDRIDLATPQGRLRVTVPAGWLGLDDRRMSREGDQTSVRLGRDATALPAGYLVQSLSISAREAPVRLRPDADAEAPWDRFACRAGDAGTGGLMACRRVAGAPTPGLRAWLPDDALTNTVLLDWVGFMPGAGVYWLLGAQTAARCAGLGPCEFRIPLSRGLEAKMMIREGQLHRWRDARAEAAPVLRAAAGLEIVDEEIVEQLQGAAFRLPR